MRGHDFYNGTRYFSAHVDGVLLANDERTMRLWRTGCDRG